jgi:choline kinase
MKRISFTNTKIDAVFLAGGKGTRIKKILKGKPKPIVDIKKKNFLKY